jgi:hypothetical protein
MSKAYIPKALRSAIAEQAHYRCGYCLTQELVIGTAMEIEHILPQALGGLTEEANLWLACAPCNAAKGDRIAAIDPLTGAWSRFFDPRRQRWHDHFAWSSTGDSMIGQTIIGRTTIVALQLNRPVMVRARRLWVGAGWHPPSDESSHS